MIRLRNRKVLTRQKRSLRYIVKDWCGRLQDMPAFIMGNGPSLKDQPLKVLSDFFTIGINRSFYLLDPTILLWQDIGLWNTEHHKLHNLQCIKLCRDISDPRHIYYNFYLRGGPYKFEKKTHILNGRGSTGPIAVQFAAALGCDPIILLGMDCAVGDDGKTDFYGTNPHWRVSTLANCKSGLEFLQKNCPAKLINCSNNNVFEENVPLMEVMATIGRKHAIGREKLISRLVHNKK